MLYYIQRTVVYVGLPERLREILQEQKFKQKELASLLEVSPGYISGLLNGRNKAISPMLAERIENRLGYSSQWLLTGEGQKFRHRSSLPGLSSVHQLAIARLETLSEREVKAVIAFIRSLPEVESILKEES